MATWTADPTTQKTIASAGKTPAVIVRFSDDSTPARVIADTYTDDAFTEDRLVAWVKLRIAAFNQRFSSFDAFSGTLDVTKTPDAPVLDAKAQAAAAQMAKNIATQALQRAKTDLALSVDADATKAAQAELDAAQVAYDAALKAAAQADVLASADAQV